MRRRIALIAILSLFSLRAMAELRLPALFSDHAVLQAGKPVAIWGWAAPFTAVKVVFVASSGGASASFTARADAAGRWSGELAAAPDGASGQLKVLASGEPEKVVNDILFGEVWLGSGQSNMEYDLAGTGRTDPKIPGELELVAQNIRVAQHEADTAKPPILFFRVLSHRAQQPMDDVKGSWILADSNNVAHISAVAWNFAVTLQNKLHVPVGMIVSSVGNTPVETWISRETLSGTSVGPAVFERSRRDLASLSPEKVAQYIAALNVWKAANPTPQLQSQNQNSRPVAPPNLSAENYVPNQYYNGMIFGLEPYTLRGVIWYQASGNMANPTEYAEMFLALIQEWRKEWKDSRLTFLFVEESGFGPKQTAPVEPNPFSILREQQHVALSLPQVGMVGSVDLDNGNPHYPDKRPVGQRLAGLALRDCYGQPGQVMSPMYQGFAVEGNRVRIRFSDADGLHADGDGRLQGFALRGNGGDWIWASARIEGQEIVVWSDRVTMPVAVRYAWAINPITSVKNGASLPLFPFRTDGESKQ